MSTQTQRASRPRVLLLLIVGLLLLRIPFLAGLRFIHWPDYESNEWLWQSYIIATYFLTTLFIFLERARLDRYHITTLSLALFIALPIIQPILLQQVVNSLRHRLAFELDRSPQVLIGLSLAASLVLSRKPRTLTGREPVAWLLVSLVAGILFGVLGWVLIDIQTYGRFKLSGLLLRPNVIAPQLAYSTVFQASVASIDEEPLFRGLMWGYFRGRGWRDSQVFLFQALLFWSAHFYRAIDQPITWFILIPIASILFGWIAWKSRSITGSMITHAISNALPGCLTLLRIY
jgi:membrane protease YdiL (CAAX protease family)